MEYLLFSILPISSVALLFLKDKNKERWETMNALLVINAILFLSPLFKAYSNTPAGESMWNENTGGGAALWIYIFIFPLCVLIQLVLLILKLVFYSNSKIKS